MVTSASIRSSINISTSTNLKSTRKNRELDSGLFPIDTTTYPLQKYCSSPSAWHIPPMQIELKHTDIWLAHTYPPSNHHADSMAATSVQLHTLHQFLARDRHRHHKNWAHANPGVVLVFCLVFIVGVGILALLIYRYWLRRKAERAAYETE